MQPPLRTGSAAAAATAAASDDTAPMTCEPPGDSPAAAFTAAAPARLSPGQAAVGGAVRGAHVGLVLGILLGVWEEKRFVLSNCLKHVRASAPHAPCN